MNRALVILNDGSMIECEYKGDAAYIFVALLNHPFVNFYKKTFACDTIARIEWID